MVDPWYSEIELQKDFSLSPGEAYCQICVKNGMSTAEISQLTGQSPNTIKTLLRRGSQKMKKTAKTCTFHILRGNKDVEGVIIKRNAVEVITRFTQKVFGTRTFVGTHSCVIYGIPSEIRGSPQIMNETVFRVADIYGTTNADEAEARANKLYAAYMALENHQEIYGVAVVKYLLDKMGLAYDVEE